MKTYKVNLKNKLGHVVLSHNLMAKNDMDANLKCLELVKNARDKSVCDYEFC